MKYIGGFFELEKTMEELLPPNKDRMHDLQSGRACLNYALKQLRPTKLYVPFYCCEALLEPLVENNVPYEYYAINDTFRPVQTQQLKTNEYLIYINYFGICGKVVEELYDIYGNRMILDNTMAFFEPAFKDCISFNSARKFFGVADGAYLCPGSLISPPGELAVNTKASTEHLRLRLEGKQEEAYKSYLQNESRISTGLKKMSTASAVTLSHVDMDRVHSRRLSNFKFYERELAAFNQLRVSAEEDMTPQFYPFLPSRKTEKQLFHKAGIFIPTLWPDLNKRTHAGFSYERDLSERLLPLPLDQRYQESDCTVVVSQLLSQTGLN
jgi:hypothetical protein